MSNNRHTIYISTKIDLSTLTLHQLRLLCAVTTHGSLTQAGEALFLSQLAVTLQLKALQQELGVVLYERLGKTLHLTEAGHVVEGYARRGFWR